VANKRRRRLQIPSAALLLPVAALAPSLMGLAYRGGARAGRFLSSWMKWRGLRKPGAILKAPFANLGRLPTFREFRVLKAMKPAALKERPSPEFRILPVAAAGGAGGVIGLELGGRRERRRSRAG
jgi:hypothetical protein